VQGVLTLQTFLPGGEKGPALDVPISGRVSGPVEFSPNQVVLSRGQNGHSILGAHVAALHNRDGTQWTIDGVESDCELVRHEVIENDTRLAAFVEEGRAETAENLPNEVTLTVAVKSDDGRRERLLLPVQLAPYKAIFRRSNAMKPYLLAAAGGLCLSWGIVSVQTSVWACEDGCDYSKTWFNNALDSDECFHFPNDNQARTGRVSQDKGTQRDIPGDFISRQKCPLADCSHNCGVVNAAWIDSDLTDYQNCRNVPNVIRSDCQGTQS
jgi:hypothetical protein